MATLVQSFPGDLLSFCESHILDRLEDFGVLERREILLVKKLLQEYNVRKLDLFDRFFGFDIWS